MRRITAAATPYGRLATTFVGAGSRAARSSLTASAKCSVAFGCGVERVAQRRLEPAVELDHVDVRGPLGEVLGQHAEPAADLEHDVVGAQLRGAADHVEDVRVDQEVLAELAVRADPELPHPAQARLRRELAHQPRSRAALASTAASSSS